jgi:GNAT superfamily N-acetyltransferase
MFWKLSPKEFSANKGEGNRLLIKAIVEEGKTPGILAYEGSIPIGWCGIEPRRNYQGLGRSRILKPIDEQDVWSITCFFVDRKFRFRGISKGLILAALDFAAHNNGRIVEGYPTEIENEKMPAPFVYTGLASSFIDAGFKESARRSPKRPIMRYYLE